MILKLKTRGAVRSLAATLFEALRYDSVGLMIARGDLAVELSFEKLAEMQEEILWLGEACHLPVTWATQVLDSVTHTGLATRAEVTDAAMSMRTECVMLNKGPHIGTVVRMLADIIHKMEAHQYKKRSLYRPLSVARDKPCPPSPTPSRNETVARSLEWAKGNPQHLTEPAVEVVGRSFITTFPCRPK
jgi:pyruvate kinase